MAKDISVAPKERVNITYEANNNGVKEQIELPNKLLVIGDFTQREDDEDVVERNVISVNKNNFNEVLEKQELHLDFTIENKLGGDEGEEIPIALDFKHLKDFEPDQVARNVPHLRKLLELREALTFLRGPLGNVPAFKKQIEALLGDDNKRAALMRELGIDEQ